MRGQIVDDYILNYKYPERGKFFINRISAEEFLEHSKKNGYITRIVDYRFDDVLRIPTTTFVSRRGNEQQCYRVEIKRGAVPVERGWLVTFIIKEEDNSNLIKLKKRKHV